MAMNLATSKLGESLCRTCLESLKGERHNILLTDDLVKKLVVCTSQSVECDDEFPKNICESCFQNLNQFHDFYIMCGDSVEKYKEMIKCTYQETIDYFADSFEIFNEESSLIKESCLQKIGKNNVLNCEVKSDKFEDECEVHVSEDDDCSQYYNEEENEKAGLDHTSIPEDLISTPVKKGRKAEDKGEAQLHCGKISTIYKCKLCPKRFVKETRFVAHVRTHDGLKAYPCTLCEKAFSRDSTLQMHFRQNHSDGKVSFQCHVKGCEKIYMHKQTLNLHIREEHKGEIKEFVCEMCGKVFKRLRFLEKHRYTHMDKSQLPFECVECNKRFVTKHNMQDHMKRHAGIKNFVCPYCGMRKTTKNELKTHINYHTKERTYPCRYCSHVCNNSGNLKMHIRIVHEGIKDYACRFCEKKFGKPDTLKHHEMRHTGEKPHECSVCGKRFIQSVAMRAHLKRHKSVKEEKSSEPI